MVQNRREQNVTPGGPQIVNYCQTYGGESEPKMCSAIEGSSRSPQNEKNIAL
jgi:hypothetical protein